jgi:hypothetical protein
VTKLERWRKWYYNTQKDPVKWKKHLARKAEQKRGSRLSLKERQEQKAMEILKKIGL